MSGKNISRIQTQKEELSVKSTESEWRIIEQKKQQLCRRSDQERAKTVKNIALYRELQGYQEAGVELWLNGKRSNSYRIANCVCEKTDYMRDYYLDVENRVCGIGFDKIRKDNQKAADIPYAKSLNYYEDFLKKSKCVRSKQ